MIKYFSIFSLIFLASCSQSKVPEFVQTPKYILRSEISSTSKTPVHSLDNDADHVSIGEWISLVDDVDKFVISYPADYPKASPIFMLDMSIERQNPSPCSPSTLGVSEPKTIALKNSESAVWGKMMMLNAYDRPIDTVCHITAPECTDEELFEGTCKTQAATYAFCSEKNEKSVVICISQVIDNPDLAKQIFETFRWTR